MRLFGLGPAEMMVCGCIFGLPLAGIVLISAIIAARRGNSQEVPAGDKKCPFCAEHIKKEAVVCRYCGRDLADPATGSEADVVV
ncbi:MAG: hypothetical protein FWE94_08515 [Coriobacteriia bacterium]|nr:hypothetical protein [Coriobacteriia bacterium]